ncbi:hypothetical protein IGI04_042633 [Brassica rapa subsp. trilocularis]|uniref:Uncharacterized protein n=1 Tax=Brassica rapa subsp. trilocularis TaxID=1813537 RepID=A0ABQ7KHW3_BRACM|nr:hypothetical protein IGI04_042633 [Brassica rapa subsp. trilocularis]
MKWIMARPDELYGKLKGLIHEVLDREKAMGLDVAFIKHGLTLDNHGRPVITLIDKEMDRMKLVRQEMEWEIQSDREMDWSNRHMRELSWKWKIENQSRKWNMMRTFIIRMSIRSSLVGPGTRWIEPKKELFEKGLYRPEKWKDKPACSQVKSIAIFYHLPTPPSSDPGRDSHSRAAPSAKGHIRTPKDEPKTYYGGEAPRKLQLHQAYLEELQNPQLKQDLRNMIDQSLTDVMEKPQQTSAPRPASRDYELCCYQKEPVEKKEETAEKQGVREQAFESEPTTLCEADNLDNHLKQEDRTSVICGHVPGQNQSEEGVLNGSPKAHELAVTTVVKGGDIIESFSCDLLTTPPEWINIRLVEYLRDVKGLQQNQLRSTKQKLVVVKKMPKLENEYGDHYTRPPDPMQHENQVIMSIGQGVLREIIDILLGIHKELVRPPDQSARFLLVFRDLMLSFYPGEHRTHAETAMVEACLWSKWREAFAAAAGYELNGKESFVCYILRHHGLTLDNHGRPVITLIDKEMDRMKLVRQEMEWEIQSDREMDWSNRHMRELSWKWKIENQSRKWNMMRTFIIRMSIRSSLVGPGTRWIEPKKELFEKGLYRPEKWKDKPAWFMIGPI